MVPMVSAVLLIPVSALAEECCMDDISITLQVRLCYGGRGVVLLTDTGLIERSAHFPRERISKRAVHSKAADALPRLKLRTISQTSLIREDEREDIDR